jgi:hypothetical protein
MADAIDAKFDVSGFLSFFRRLDEKAMSLASRMAVSGGIELRDEAIRNAPESSPPYNPYSRGSQQSGTLKKALYLARSERLSSTTRAAYSVSWNRQIAWWGHLAEFGYWQKYKVVKHPEGFFMSTGDVLPEQEWIRIPGSRFLSRTYDTTLERAKQAMLERGRQEVQILLREP